MQQTGEPIEPITIYTLSMEWFILGLLLYILCLLFRDESKITSFLLLLWHNYHQQEIQVRFTYQKKKKKKKEIQVSFVFLPH